jgi:hypothetical protein
LRDILLTPKPETIWARIVAVDDARKSTGEFTAIAHKTVDLGAIRALRVNILGCGRTGGCTVKAIGVLRTLAHQAFATQFFQRINYVLT